MIQRRALAELRVAMGRQPVVGLIGPRQIGKSTLAHQIEDEAGTAIYLDLERPSDLVKLSDPEAYLERHETSLVILDEVQRAPHLFPILRALVDANRSNGRFLLLGSAAPTLARQGSESLAGRIAYLELAGLSLGEVGASPGALEALWLRGGFPRSFLALGDRESYVWREDFIRTFLERDVPSLGFRVPAASLRRFWQMLAHSHGQVWNASPLASGLGIDGKTVRRYLDILEDSFLIRRLPPFHANLKKRLVKSPKVYLRDSGLLHALLGLSSHEDILGHPILGPSWAGWVIEQILTALPRGCEASFFRSAAGAEIDLVIARPAPLPPLAIEIKTSSAPRLERGFWSALADLPDARALVVCRAKEVFPLARGVMAVPAADLAKVAWLDLDPADGLWRQRQDS